MSNAKRGLKALGLSLLAAMGLMAFLAAGAQATWDLEGIEIIKDIPVGGNFVAGQEGLLLVPTQNLVIHCKKFTIEKALLLKLPALDADADLKYEDCKTLVKGVENAGCKPEILPVKALLLPFLHNGEIYILAEQQTGVPNFTVIHYNEETCALPPLPAVTGSVVFECYKEALKLDDCKNSLAIHLIRPAPPALFPTDTLKYGLNAAEIHGEAEVFLTGEDLNKKWNALV